MTRRWNRAWLCALVASSPANADPGIEVGARGGVELHEDVDAYTGVDLRLSTSRSPLTVAVTFDKFFDEDLALAQLGLTALYRVPVRGRLAPYAGVGLALTTFAYRANTPGVDNEGYRAGVNLVAGAAFDLGPVSPYVQVTQGLGEFDLRTVGAGLLVHARTRRGDAAPPPPARWVVTPYADNNALGDVQSGRIGLGVSVDYAVHPHLGFELDGELHGHFFRDEDVAGLVADGVDLNTQAALASAGVVAPYCAGAWCGYAIAGAGVVHAAFDGRALAPGTQPFARTQTNPALDAGVGITHALSSHVGLRVDARYIRAFAGAVDPFPTDYGFVRLSAGVSVRLGRVRS